MDRDKHLEQLVIQEVIFFVVNTPPNPLEESSLNSPRRRCLSKKNKDGHKEQGVPYLLTYPPYLSLNTRS
jgi:hypothetical protein